MSLPYQPTDTPNSLSLALSLSLSRSLSLPLSLSLSLPLSLSPSLSLPLSLQVHVLGDATSAVPQRPKPARRDKSRTWRSQSVMSGLLTSGKTSQRGQQGMDSRRSHTTAPPENANVLKPVANPKRFRGTGHKAEMFDDGFLRLLVGEGLPDKVWCDDRDWRKVRPPPGENSLTLTLIGR
jgi:hypothetical protein